MSVNLHVCDVCALLSATSVVLVIVRDRLQSYTCNGMPISQSPLPPPLQTNGHVQRKLKKIEHGNLHPLVIQQSLQLSAWCIFGEPFRPKAFREELSSCLRHHGEVLPSEPKSAWTDAQLCMLVEAVKYTGICFISPRLWSNFTETMCRHVHPHSAEIWALKQRGRYFNPSERTCLSSDV